MSSDNPRSLSAAHDHNRRAWDEMARAGRRFARPAQDEDLVEPLKKVDGPGWLKGDIQGKRLLCLAAGGGRQSAIYASAGAVVTVVDISPAMLELDRQVATKRGLDIHTVETSMDDLSMFCDQQFDLVIQPVSTCYVENIFPVYREVARILRHEGIYISQHKTPGSLQTDTKPSPQGYQLIEPYYRNGPLPAVVGSKHREEGTLEYLHRWEEILGYLCRAGFVIEDLLEPLHADPQAEIGSFEHRSRFVAPYVRIKARRRTDSASQTTELWTP